MQVIKTEIPGLLIIQPRIFQDNRGYFFESYHKRVLSEQGLTADFVQDNQSLSQKGVLRGLHFQAPPHAQGKLVCVIKGAVLDVAVDIRKDSPSYGKHVAVELNEKNKTMLWIPEGFAHGFLTLQDNTIFSYKCTNYYNKESEGSILWSDPEIAISWGSTSPVLSEKDIRGIPLKEFSTPFLKMNL
ncbi:MAG TPA: dTDP-4-dehydrorhamnose 3,5-epimerase [Bacteroidia bacterium]|jgi:dTDP-4-dehydrorhamnose 3,5-epimerase